jgi:DNA end-binding protein Ku
VLQSLLWPDEVREANFPSLDASIKISAQERDMSAALVESMAADFDPAHFTDDYQVQLRQLIEAKLEQGDSLDTEETFGVEAGEGGKGEVIDLMEALKRSLDRKRGGGADASAAISGGGDSGDEASGDDEEAAKPARKRASASKSADSSSTGSKSGAAKSTAAKTSTAKTSPAKASTAKSAPDKSTAAKSASAKSTAKPAAKTTTSKATGTRARKPA